MNPFERVWDDADTSLPPDLFAKHAAGVFMDKRDGDAIEQAEALLQELGGPEPVNRPLRRVKAFTIGANTLMDLFSALARGRGRVMLPASFDWPEGAEVVSVHSDPMSYRSFTVYVEHPSFPPVNDGEQIPVDRCFEETEVRVTFDRGEQP